MEMYCIQPDASIYYVTYSVIEWLPVFIAEAPCKIVTDSLTYCHANKGLRVNAYVIMPTHVHAIVFHEDHDADRLAAALDNFRRFTGQALADYCLEHAPAPFTQAFRYAAGQDRARRFWQPTRHPVALQTQAYWQQKIDYIHANPCRKGLVLYPEDWCFSSARYYAAGNGDCANVPVTQLDW